MTYLRIATALAVLALLSGHELADRQRTRTVPVTRVDPRVCVANGPIVAVTEHVDEPGVFHVRCASGVVLVAGER